MLVLLLACAPPTSDSGISGLPPWQGTQIGEEGDGPCDTERVAWDQEDQAPEGLSFSPAELRARLAGDLTGTLETPHQGQAPLDARLVLDGPAWLVQEVDCSDQWLELEGQLEVEAAPLLGINTPVSVRSSWVSLTLNEGEWSGDLSPGTLPTDAGDLSLRLSAHLSPGEDSALEWLLERPEGDEVQRAGGWTLAD